MLVEFKVTNFKSIRARQHLSFLASPDRAHEATHCVATGAKGLPRLCSTALIVGPNGSGKSNFVGALATMQALVLHSTAFSDHQFADCYSPFESDLLRSAPTEFEVDVVLDTLRYRYTIAYNEERILLERLLVNRTGKPQRWFERRYETSRNLEEWSTFSASFSGPREMWVRATRCNALFLTIAAQLNSASLAPLFQWFKSGLEIVRTRPPDLWAKLLGKLKDSAFRSRAVALLKSADIPVGDMRVSPLERLPLHAVESPPLTSLDERVGQPALEFSRPGSEDQPIWLGDQCQGTGTRRLMELADPVLGALAEAKLLVIDGLDTHLHPLVARLLIQLFHDPDGAARGTQLLCTTLNPLLMDLELLRRDEIWLMELDAHYATSLTPLGRARSRSRDGILKGYLQGKYGGVPSIRPPSTTPFDPS